MFALTLAAAAVAGLVLGMLGGGGSILTLPILVYLAGMPTREAIAASLVVVAATSTIALIPHARARRIRWRTAIGFAAAGTVGAYTGGRLADLIPATFLLVGFGLLMAAAAIVMLRPRNDQAATPPRPRSPMTRTAPLGGLVGLVTGLVGAGGGFVIVPALSLMAGLTIADAIGTSLFVIAAQSTAGLLGHLHHSHLDWAPTLAVTAASIAGSILGARLAGRLPHAALRRAFGWFVIAMATVVLLQQTPTAARQWLSTTPAGWAALAAGIAATAAVIALTRARRRPKHRPLYDEPTGDHPAQSPDCAVRTPAPTGQDVPAVTPRRPLSQGAEASR